MGWNRQVIRGKAYDPNTATQVARGDYGDEGEAAGSNACWILYRTQGGAFFEASTDHDGSPNPIQPLSRIEAKRWLQKCAPHLVEKYFGEVPEASARGYLSPAPSPLAPAATGSENLGGQASLAHDIATSSESVPTPSPVETKKVELLTLRPTLWGIGIDLKELWRRFSAWRRDCK